MFAQIESALPTCWAINRKHRLSALRSFISATTRSKSTRAFSYAPNCSRPRWLIVDIFLNLPLDPRPSTLSSLAPRPSSLPPVNRHREVKRRSDSRIVFGPDLTVVRLHDGACDRQSHAHPFFFSCKEGLEQFRQAVNRYAGTGVSDCDFHRPVV